MNEHIPSTELGDGPIQPAYHAQMNAIADVLHETFNGPNVPISKAKVAFVLMVFPTGQPDGKHRCNYIATADRQDVISMSGYKSGLHPQLRSHAVRDCGDCMSHRTIVEFNHDFLRDAS